MPGAVAKEIFHARLEPTSVQRICPHPKQWNDIFGRLLDYADRHACSPDRPPTPLILGGWWASNDTEKMLRWRETVIWATANGCLEIVEDIPEVDFYQVDKPSTYSIGPLGGPCYRAWDFEPKVRPSQRDISERLDYLSAHWTDIAGPDLASVTRPLKFTGSKARRLLVHADRAEAPPWGGWMLLSSDESKRRAFTRFRSAINKAVAPHEVDHIEFSTDPS